MVEEVVLGALDLPCVPLVDGIGCRCCGRVSSVGLEVLRGVVRWVDQVLEDCSVLVESLVEAEKVEFVWGLEVLVTVARNWLKGIVVLDGLVMVVVVVGDREAEIVEVLGMV